MCDEKNNNNKSQQGFLVLNFDFWTNTHVYTVTHCPHTKECNNTYTEIKIDWICSPVILRSLVKNYVSKLRWTLNSNQNNNNEITIIFGLPIVPLGLLVELYFSLSGRLNRLHQFGNNDIECVFQRPFLQKGVIMSRRQSNNNSPKKKAYEVQQ